MKTLVSGFNTPQLLVVKEAEMNEYEIERGASFTGEKQERRLLNTPKQVRLNMTLSAKWQKELPLPVDSIGNFTGYKSGQALMFKITRRNLLQGYKAYQRAKATMIVRHFYDTIEGEYDSTIFTAERIHRALIRRPCKSNSGLCVYRRFCRKSIERNLPRI